MKPILFNSDMVRAILEGRKTVTRRVIKDKDIINAWDCESDGTPIAFIDQATGDSHAPTFPCQYQPGNILYVRETWNKVKLASESDWHYEYMASCENPAYFSNGFMAEWRPSIHMPKEAARLFLRVTDVRVERLQEIHVYEMEKEGLRASWGEGIIGAWKDTWNSTIKPADLPLYGWDANPWVWVIEFERVSKEAALKGGAK